MGERFLVKVCKGRKTEISLAKLENMMLNELAFNADIDISEYDEVQLIMGLDEESEHEDVTGGDPIMTLKIVIAHLKEDSQYYTKLEQAMSKGGQGSGNFGHTGRPGEIGGSSSEGVGHKEGDNVYVSRPDYGVGAQSKGTYLRPSDKYPDHSIVLLEDGSKLHFQDKQIINEKQVSNMLSSASKRPDGSLPLRAKLKYGDEVVFNTGGETLRGTLAGKNEKGEMKIVTYSGTIHYRNRNEVGMPVGGYKQRGE